MLSACSPHLRGATETRRLSQRLGCCHELGPRTPILPQVERSQSMMFFVSKGYFKSANCLREVRGSLTKSKPIVLVHDPDKGGASVAWIKKQEVPPELVEPVFASRRAALVETPRPSEAGAARARSPRPPPSGCCF